MSVQCERLAERDGWFCDYCGIPLAHGDIGMMCHIRWPGEMYVAPGFARAEVDHVVPRCRGGSNDPRNLVLACGTCNGQKGTKTADEYRLWLRQMIEQYGARRGKRGGLVPTAWYRSRWNTGPGSRRGVWAA